MMPLVATVDLNTAERVGLAEAKANLSRLVTVVEQTGDPCVIMRYGRPAAALVPLPTTQPACAGAARGILSRYADAAKRKLEEGAFAREMVEKHGNPA